MVRIIIRCVNSADDLLTPITSMFYGSEPPANEANLKNLGKTIGVDEEMAFRRQGQICGKVFRNGWSRTERKSEHGNRSYT